MTNVPAGIDDIEEAKSVVESEELADDRYGVTTTNSDTTSPNLVTATGSPNLFNTCDGVSVVESIPAAEVKDVVRNDEGDNADTDAENNDKNAVKQIQMTVAADAPWKDRLWEGSFYANVLVRSGCLVQRHFVIRHPLLMRHLQLLCT